MKGKKDVDMSWPKVIARFKALRWFVPNPFWCHGAAGLIVVVLGLVLTCKALGGNFDLHNSWILFFYYFASWIILGSTWGLAKKLPAYCAIYRSVSLQGISMIYFGLRFRPNTIVNIPWHKFIGAPELLIAALDVGAAGMLIVGIIGTIIYAPAIARGETKVDSSFGVISLIMICFSIFLAFPVLHLALYGEEWMTHISNNFENLKMAITAFGFVPATWMLVSAGNFNNLKNRLILTQRCYENCAFAIVSTLLVLCVVASEIHFGNSAKFGKLLMPMTELPETACERALDVSSHVQWLLQKTGF